MPPKNPNGKNANSSAENKPMQKVKKTYIWYRRRQAVWGLSPEPTGSSSSETLDSERVYAAVNGNALYAADGVGLPPRALSVTEAEFLTRSDSREMLRDDMNDPYEDPDDPYAGFDYETPSQVDDRTLSLYNHQQYLPNFNDMVAREHTAKERRIFSSAAHLGNDYADDALYGANVPVAANHSAVYTRHPPQPPDHRRIFRSTSNDFFDVSFQRDTHAAFLAQCAKVKREFGNCGSRS